MPVGRRSESVVVTGVAVVSPIGVGFQAFSAGLRRGEAGFGELVHGAQTTEVRELRGAQLQDFDPAAVLGRKGLRYLDRTTKILLACIQLDLGDVLDELRGDGEPGLVVGTVFGSLTSQIDYNAAYVRDGFPALTAIDFPNVVINTPPSQANIRFGLTESSTTVANGFTAGLDAIALGADQIRIGRSQTILAGGAEELPLHAGLAWERRGLTSPSGRVRPFDDRHDGTLLGEGAALVLLESRDHAERRGAAAMAEVLGHACSFDGVGGYVFNPAAEGAVRAMEDALGDAGIEPDQVDLIAASADGSVDGDDLERTALERVFGSRLSSIPVVAYRSYWGQCFGAGGALATAAALADVSDGIVSGTCGTASGSSGLAVSSEPVLGADLRVVLVNDFGRTGNNSSLLLQRIDGEA